MIKHKIEQLTSSPVDEKVTCNVCHREFKSLKALKTHFSTSHHEKTKKGFDDKHCSLKGEHRQITKHKVDRVNYYKDSIR